MPPGSRGLQANEYTLRKPPYAKGLPEKHVYLGISGLKENLPHMPDGIFQRPIRLNAAEVRMRETMGTMGRTLTPYRAGVTTDGVKHNKYRSRCFGRGACNRRSGGCDIHAAFDSPTGLIYPANDTGNLTIRTNATVREVSVDATSSSSRTTSRTCSWSTAARLSARRVRTRRGRSWRWRGARATTSPSS